MAIEWESFQFAFHVAETDLFSIKPATFPSLLLTLSGLTY